MFLGFNTILVSDFETMDWAREEIKRRYGLLLIESVETGELAGCEISRATIFRKPQAPLIEVNCK